MWLRQKKLTPGRSKQKSYILFTIQLPVKTCLGIVYSTHCFRALLQDNNEGRSEKTMEIFTLI